jgi:hypothetical protein
MGIPNGLQNADRHDTLSASLQEDMSPSRRTRTQSFLGHQKVEHGPQGSRHKKKTQIAELEEWREKAYHSAKLYKERTKRCHDKRIKTMQLKPVDKVLLFNSHVHLFGHGKLHSKWEGPYLVLHTADHGAVTLQCDDGDIFMANGQRIKLFLEPNPQDFEEVVVLNFLELE